MTKGFSCIIVVGVQEAERDDGVVSKLHGPLCVNFSNTWRTLDLGGFIEQSRFQTPTRPFPSSHNRKPSCTGQKAPPISGQTRRDSRPNHDSQVRPSNHHSGLFRRHGQRGAPNPRPLLVVKPCHSTGRAGSQPPQPQHYLLARFTSLERPQKNMHR